MLPAVTEIAAAWRDLLPNAIHVWVDTAEQHSGTGAGADFAYYANDRRHAVLDLVLGHDRDPDRPFLREVVQAGGEHLLDLDPIDVDILGLDYYCHSEWFFDDTGGRAPSPRPAGFRAVATQYAQRYRRPMMLTETNIRGFATDRASWLRYMLGEYEALLDDGVDLRGFCWFPHVDSCDWDSLLARYGGRTDPVGVLSAGRDGRRERSLFTDVWSAAARGCAAADLPAFRFQEPCATQLVGYRPAMAGWPWQDPPTSQLVPPRRAPHPEGEPVVLDASSP